MNTVRDSLYISFFLQRVQKNIAGIIRVSDVMCLNFKQNIQRSQTYLVRETQFSYRFTKLHNKLSKKYFFAFIFIFGQWYFAHLSQRYRLYNTANFRAGTRHEYEIKKILRNWKTTTLLSFSWKSRLLRDKLMGRPRGTGVQLLSVLPALSVCSFCFVPFPSLASSNVVFFLNR